MSEIDTKNLEKTLERTSTKDFQKYIKDNKDSMIDMANDFSQEFKKILQDKGISQRALFQKADISESYGYKILSKEKLTHKRDVILRLTIAAGLNLKQTQRILRKYDLPELYAKQYRDALIMMAINEGKSINDINQILIENDFKALEMAGDE